MTKETLIQLGLTEEQAGKVLEGLEDSFVPQARFDEVNRELKAAQNTIRERDGQLETLQQSTGDDAALQAQIAQLQATNAQQKKAHEEEMKQVKLAYAVDKALADAKAIHPATVKPLLATFLEKAALSEDGTVQGLAEEVEKLAKAERTSFLFRADTAPTVSGASPVGSVTTSPDPKASDYAARLADARKAGNGALVVAIKREAAADGVALF